MVSSAQCQRESGWFCPAAGGRCSTQCGDRIIAGAERCDDGNASGGDGCSAACQVESGWVCAAPGVPCARKFFFFSSTKPFSTLW